MQFERIISDLKRGKKIVIFDTISQTSILFSSAELIKTNTLLNHKQICSSYPSVLLSANRCKSLGIKTNENCSCTIDLNWTKDDILSLAFSKKENFNLQINGLIAETNEISKYCLLLLKKAKLLPTAIVTLISGIDINKIYSWSREKNLICIDVQHLDEILKKNLNNDLEIVAKAHLPIKQTKDCDLIVFRSKDDLNEYFCLLIGKTRSILKKNKSEQIPLVRIHSQCITGDILHSLKCDCGQQLKKSIDLMVENNGGILIYLSQEGRNIGLTNKLRSYNLQDEGLDTIDANLTLGFEDDERTYEIAKEILEILKVKKIELITNNPNKIKELKKMGISIKNRIPIVIKPNNYNKKYLKSKKLKSSHFL